MNNQEYINRAQRRINISQTKENDSQHAINEQTKIDISMRSFWGIMVVVVGAALTLSTAYLVNNFRIASDIEKIDINIAFIKAGLEKHLSDSVEAQKNMRIVASQRDAKFLEIDKQLVRIFTTLKLDP